MEGLLLMLLLVGKFVAETTLAKVFGVVNALVLIMRASDNVRDIGAIVVDICSSVFASLQWNMR